MQRTQQIHDIILWIYYGTLCLASIYATFRWRKLDKTSKYICAFIWLGALSELIGWYFTQTFNNNLPVYAICNIVELCIISLYFNNLISGFQKFNIGMIIASVGGLLGTVNIVFFEPLKTISFNFVFFECVIIVCLCLYSVFLMLVAEEDHVLWKEFHFWTTCTLLFYQCASLWNWGIYNYTTQLSSEKIALLNISMLFINVITYLALTYLLYQFPKLRKSNV